MSSTQITSTPNLPANRLVFDFKMDNGLFCRVPFDVISKDAHNMVITGWAFQIDESGNPVLDPASGSPVATIDRQKTVSLSGVIAGTHSLYDGWVRYVQPSQVTLDETSLPAGWATGAGRPTDPAAYGSGYYDTTAQLGYTYQQGCLIQAASTLADELCAQMKTQSDLAALGL